MFAKALVHILLLFVTLTWGSLLPYPPPSPYEATPYPVQGRPYKFEYGIKDDYVGANYGHEEDSDGQLVKGTYYVVLPDGRFQTVQYQADDAIGYVADVEYKGDAQHPPHYAPAVTFRSAYKPVAPVTYPTTTDPPSPPPTTIPYVEEE